MSSSLSCTEASSLTDTELNAFYSPSTGGNLLPSTSFSTSDRDASGMLTTAAINRVVTSLQSTNVIPNPSPADTYGDRRRLFVNNVKSEYCFYQQRYMYALKQLFAAIRADTANRTTTSTTVSGEVRKYLTLCQTLNTRVNDVLQIITGISSQLMSRSDELQIEMDAIRADLQDQKDSLEKQAKILSSTESTATIQKQMVKFSEEKARRTNNLLNMYSALNLIALGLLVYVYRASGSGSE